MRIVVLGSTGMLGSEVVRVCIEAGHEVVEVSRTRGVLFDVSNQVFSQLAKSLELCADDYVVNCIGWIPQKSSGDYVLDELQARLLNTELPRQINESSGQMGFQWIQIGTDCVFDGLTGDYSESSPKNATDIYGQSKVRGEQLSNRAILIRSSIIGPDRRTHAGLYSWFLKEQSQGKAVTGYQNHRWNGVSTTAFGRLVAGMAKLHVTGPQLAHWIPSDSVTKFELLRLFCTNLNFPIGQVRPGFAEKNIDRTLATDHLSCNFNLWRMAGYAAVPSVGDLVRELVQVDLEHRS